MRFAYVSIPFILYIIHNVTSVGPNYDYLACTKGLNQANTMLLGELRF